MMNITKNIMIQIKEYIKRVSTKIFTKFPADPWGHKPIAPQNKYLKLHQEAKLVNYQFIDDYEREVGHSINRNYFEELALHTQVVIKDNVLNYQHGRILYTTLSSYLAQNSKENITIFETGTARGFSSVCMAKALLDHNQCGKIITVDILPHNSPMIWNTIDDHAGKRSREQLLSKWAKELTYIIFIKEFTHIALTRIGIKRINFAFLDAQHTKLDVLSEYEFIKNRQLIGDIIVFDDVTPGLFDGIVRAIDEIEKEGNYNINRLSITPTQGYAIAVRIK